jgi:MFS family permease
MDTAGAMLGPLLAFAILAITHDAYDAVFVTSFSFALMGVGVLLLFVQDRRPSEVAAAEETPVRRASLRSSLALLADPPFRRVALVATGLSLATVSDGFLYLQLQQQADVDPTYFPLLAVAMAGSYMVLAVPVGALADRFGRARVFLAGYVLLGAVYVSLLTAAAGIVGMLAALVALGAYYAATDGVLMALVSSRLPVELRGSGLALLVTGTSLGGLVASVCFGALWSAYGAEDAVRVFVVALALAIVAAAVVLRGVGRRAEAPA